MEMALTMIITPLVSSEYHKYMKISCPHENFRYTILFNLNHSNDYFLILVTFWNVVSTLSEDQKRKLLKFVTSCSRPPLLGFKELDPPFCIQNAGTEPDRLPTASTCMNLLKLPEFRDETTLRTKLLYAIEADAGFELS